VADGRGGVYRTCACADIAIARTGRSYQFLHCTVAYHRGGERTANVSGGIADMNADGKSDESIVPSKLVNNGGAEPSAELAEERDSTKRNDGQSALHRPLGETARWLRSVVQGWLNSHSVPSNSNRIGRFVDEGTRLWLHVIRRRSQRGRCWTWKRMHPMVRKHLPRPRIIYSYPDQRFHARLKVGTV